MDELDYRVESLSPPHGTIGDIVDSIETNLWLAESYDQQGAFGLARECLSAALMESGRFSPLLNVCTEFIPLQNTIARMLRVYPELRELAEQQIKNGLEIGAIGDRLMESACTLQEVPS